MYDDLEGMLAKLLEAARKLPPGEVRHEILIEIGRFRVRIDAFPSGPDSYGPLRDQARSPRQRDHRAHRVDNRWNSARLPLYLAAGRVLSNPPIMVP